jgi:23S rRNA pseudouridine1911/1915/1917 synthase
VELRVLFRDERLAVVDKPAGLAVDEDVLALAARALAPPGGRAWPRIVHRLDRGTSGCLLFALRKESEAFLARAFDEGRVFKTYLAVVEGTPPARQSIDTPYGPDPRDRRKFTTRIDTPRRARLSYEVVRQFEHYALLKIDLDTGRTHQIRVQLSESGFPVLGDETYGRASPLIARPALHAFKLSIPDVLEVEAPVPPDIEELVRV